MPYKTKEDRNRHFREKRLTDKDFLLKGRAANKKWWSTHGADLKIEVLSHYGKDGKLQCCWEGCHETDRDVLTLDHINNDGAKQRRDGQQDGNKLRRQLKSKGFPLGYQTLCWNHQWKKEMNRRRADNEG